jgi:hypothetical protein
MTSTPPRKRSHESVGSGGGLLMPEFDGASDRASKRGRFENTSSAVVDVDDTTAAADIAKNTNCSSSRTLFLQCHSMMLQSLYQSNDKSIIPSSTWDQISAFLSRRQKLLTLVQKSIHLSALLSESRSICTKPPLTAPLKRMNTSLKTESKFSFSFITQSQQGQIHSLNLNSPTATRVNRDVLSPFYRKNFGGAGSSGQKRIRGYIHRRQNKSQDREMCRDNNTFNSMNLVTSILQKRYRAAVLLVQKEREPFLPLLEDIKEHIHTLDKQQKDLEKHLTKEFDVSNMTEQQLRLAASHVGFGGGRVSDTYTEGRSEIAKIRCRLGLWRALSASLESVICSPL